MILKTHKARTLLYKAPYNQQIKVSNTSHNLDPNNLITLKTLRWCVYGLLSLSSVGGAEAKTWVVRTVFFCFGFWTNEKFWVIGVNIGMM